MEIVLIGPRDTSFDPHTDKNRLPLEDWLSMHFELHGPFADEKAARKWLQGLDLHPDRYWAILPIQEELR